MAAQPLPRALAQQALDAHAAANGNSVTAARMLKLNLSTFKHRMRSAKDYGLTASRGLGDPNDPATLKARIRELEQAVAGAEKAMLTDIAVKTQIVQLARNMAEIEPPAWTLRASRDDDSPGVPTLFLSDLHWGEVVDPSQIGNVNQYNLRIASRRLEYVAEKAVRLLDILSPKRCYPGIVVALGGDMISGNIHEELQATNEIDTMPTVLDLYGKLCAFIDLMADTYGRVFVPCVTGNHGRNTHKIWAKRRNHTSFDWLLYQFLAKRFERDKRVTFLIPDGSDAYYRIFNHRYLLTHGDQFRGGDGMIGALGPIIRGDHKKRSRNAQIDQAYDTMIMGHWHQYHHMTKLVVNGSLKGYDEYASQGNFSWEPPQQALWLTHPAHGMTIRAPVFAVPKKTDAKTEWVAIAA